jgi:hypothetical protein
MGGQAELKAENRAGTPVTITVMVYLGMAFLSGVGGVALLVWQGLHPENRLLTIHGTGISVGWILLVVAVYDLVRWRSRRAMGRQSEPVAEAWRPRRRIQEREDSRPPVTPDPTFDFTREPPSKTL